MNTKKKISFFIPLKKIPTITTQEKKITIVNNKPVVYETQELKNTRQLFITHLTTHAPEKEFVGPLRLTTKWLFPTTHKHLIGKYKTTKPDTDNMIKLFKDCMTVVGFWKDDALIASEITEKFWNSVTGIYVEVEELE